MVDFKTLFKREGEESIIGLTKLSLAMVLEAEGLLLCEIENWKEDVLNEIDLVCTDDENSFFNYDDGAIALHYEPEHPDKRLYLISSSPPRVTEYDVTSFRNHFISKVYLT